MGARALVPCPLTLAPSCFGDEESGPEDKGAKTYAIRELVAQALADPATREAAIAEFRKALARGKSVIPAMEFAAKVSDSVRDYPGHLENRERAQC
jgi:hypothetical protein